MDIKLIRAFHAVGQGAFYSEHFTHKSKDIFNAVYDCGSMPKTKSIDKMIDSSLEKNNIDILFISHFDNDHVNGIKVLKNQRIIKKLFYLYWKKIKKSSY